MAEPSGYRCRYQSRCRNSGFHLGKGLHGHVQVGSGVTPQPLCLLLPRVSEFKTHGPPQGSWKWVVSVRDQSNCMCKLGLTVKLLWETCPGVWGSHSPSGDVREAGYQLIPPTPVSAHQLPRWLWPGSGAAGFALAQQFAVHGRQPDAIYSSRILNPLHIGAVCNEGFN